MLKITRLGFTLLLLLALSVGVKAQHSDVKFERLSLEQGLSQTNVKCIVQDRQGFMWFGTEDGLNRYDGYSFTAYKYRLQDATSLSNSSITSLYEDKSGTLWIGTLGGGLNRYDPRSQTFTAYLNDPNNPSSISSNEVHAICEDQSGTLWIGTSDGLNRLDPKSGKFVIYRHDLDNPSSLISNNVMVVQEDSSGMLWIGTWNSGLSRYDPRSHQFTSYKYDANYQSSLSSNAVRAIYEDRSGAIWIGTEGGGLNRYDPNIEQFTSYRHDDKNPAGISNDDVRAIYEDSSGTLWVGTVEGLNKFETKRGVFTSYHKNPNDAQSISSNKAISIYEDRSGVLWIGTYDGGLSKYDPKRRRFASYNFDPKNPNVKAIYEDSGGALWVGTYVGGLKKYDPKSGTIVSYLNDLKNPASISGNDIEVIWGDREGNLWIATREKGLNRYNPKEREFTVYRHDPKNTHSISSDYILSIYEDRSGILWIGTYGGGLNRFDPESGTFTAYRHDPEKPNSITGNNIYAISGDRSGALWIGTQGGGLNKFDPVSQTFTAFRNDPKDPKSLSNSLIVSIYEDRKGVLWVGTAGGLNRFEPSSGSFTQFTEKDGLANDFIYGILEDSDGNLWLSTNKGISKFNPLIREFKNYDVGDGLQSNEFNSGAYFKSRRGEMFFGGINGLNRFYPDQIKDNPYIPPVAITSFKILDNPTVKASLIMAQSVGLVDQALELSYKENVFSFEFSALNFTRPEKNQYAYILEGFDKDWIKSGTQRYVRYTNLDPGEYVFRVKGSNNDGVWNEKGTTVRIKIMPPPWRTWWAYLLYAAGLMSVGYGGYRYRLNAIEKRHQIERAVEINRKNEELTEQKEALAIQKEALTRKNEELACMNQELIESNRRADRIFSAFAEALPGTILDEKYRLDEKIGSGGFGAVYRATHLAMKRPIAVKVFKPSPGNDSAEALERFQMEAVSACRINHPNAVAVLDSGISSEGIAYLVMELLEGHTLTQELRRSRILSVKRAAQILIPVCDVLDKAHSAGIVHRDIKPDNIFLHRNEHQEIVKVVDFGIAKLMESTGSLDVKSLTGTGGIIGTPTYMSPERLDGKPYDGRSDVYSLAVVIYEMLCGRVPFQIDSRGVFGLVQMHLTKEPQPLRELNPNIPEEVEALVMRALAKDPDRRPSAKELGEQFLSASGIDILSPADTAEEWQERASTVEGGGKWELTEEGARRIEKILDSMTISDLQKKMESLIAAEEQAKKECTTTPEKWRRIEAIVYSLLECEPDRRDALLNEACGEDADLRREVEGIFAAYQDEN
jgi:ligand-binding sensor domain-containing protein/serine/threonine protein kinase